MARLVNDIMPEHMYAVFSKNIYTLEERFVSAYPELTKAMRLVNHLEDTMKEPNEYIIRTYTSDDLVKIEESLKEVASGQGEYES